MTTPLPRCLRCVICKEPAAYKAKGGAACSPEHIRLAARRWKAKKK